PLNDTTPPPLPTTSLHDALPIQRSAERGPAAKIPHVRRCAGRLQGRDGVGVAGLLREVQRRLAIGVGHVRVEPRFEEQRDRRRRDRKSTRLNSSHLGISYAVFCL